MAKGALLAVETRGSITRRSISAHSLFFNPTIIMSIMEAWTSACEQITLLQSLHQSSLGEIETLLSMHDQLFASNVIHAEAQAALGAQYSRVIEIKNRERVYAALFFGRISVDSPVFRAAKKALEYLSELVAARAAMAESSPGVEGRRALRSKYQGETPPVVTTKAPTGTRVDASDSGNKSVSPMMDEGSSGISARPIARARSYVTRVNGRFYVCVVGEER